MSSTPFSLGASRFPEVLEFLLEQQGQEADRKLVDQSLRRLSQAQLSAKQLLIRAAGDAGMILTVVRQPLREALRLAHAEYPWIGMRIGADGEMEPILLLESRGSKALVSEPGRNRKPRWIPVAELAGWLQASALGGELEWLVPESSSPLAAMRSPNEKEPLSPWARLRALLASERSTLWVAVIYSIVIGLLSLVVPVTVQSLVNTVAFGSVLQPLVVLTMFVFVALGFSALINSLRAWVVEILQRSIFARVGTDTTWRLLRVKPEAFDKYHGPELVNRFFDVITVQKAAATLLIDGLGILMQTVIGLMLVALYHPLLLAFDIFLVASMLFIIIVLGRGAVKTSIKESKSKYAFQAWLEQIATHIVTFKSAGGMEFAAAKAEGMLEDYLHAREKHFKILIRQIAGSFVLQAVASAVLLGIGGWLVISRQLTLGQLVASELIVTLMVSGFTKFGKQLEVFYDLQAAIDKLGALVDLPLERAGGEAVALEDGPAEIRMSDVELSYYPGSKVLSIEKCELRRGDRVALSGKHGCGKSTLAAMLFGLRQPQSGSLLLDGIDYRSLPLMTIREQVVLIRGIELFPGTILENVRLGRNHISIAEVTEAMRKCGILEEIQHMPDGLDSILQPGGRPLSASQACRLMLARAIAGKPRLIILDDALDSVDREREREPICDMLFDPKAPWTILSISERPDLMARCNRLLVMEDGNLREVKWEGGKA